MFGPDQNHQMGESVVTLSRNRDTLANVTLTWFRLVDSSGLTWKLSPRMISLYPLSKILPPNAAEPDADVYIDIPGPKLHAGQYLRVCTRAHDQLMTSNKSLPRCASCRLLILTSAFTVRTNKLPSLSLEQLI